MKRVILPILLVLLGTLSIYAESTIGSLTNRWDSEKEQSTQIIKVVHEMEGLGTKDEPFLVSTIADLIEISSDTLYCDKHYLQINDIDAITTLNLNEGAGFSPIGYYNDSFYKSFTGSYDGQGYIISSLYINMPNDYFIGLFASTHNAEISNIALIDVNINSGGTAGSLVGRNNYSIINNCYATGVISGANRSIGGLVGINYHATISNSYAAVAVAGANHSIGGLVGFDQWSTINNSHATGSVTGSDNLGGLVGWSRSIVIKDCYATGDISGGLTNSGGLVGYTVMAEIDNCYATGNVTGTVCVGGLAGYANNSLVNNCYASGDVTGTSKIGGFSGYSNSRFSRSYSRGAVSGDDQVGGFVGDGMYRFTTDSFWDIETSEQTTSSGGIGKTTLEMQDINTYLNAGWDFVDEVTNGTEDIWAIHPELNLGYPYIVGPEFNSPEIVNFVPSETEITIKLGNPLVFSIIAETMHGDIVYKWYVNKTEQDSNTHIFNYQFTEPLEYQVKAVVSNGSYSAEQAWNVNVAVSNDDNAVVPLTTGLVSNYPNPFNPDTTIQYSLKEAGKISITIYDLRGRVVRKLHNAYKNAGVHSVTWNGLNSDEQDVASGVYLIRMKSEDGNHTRKITLLK